jgi:Icc-related predicted phosphoesterase
MKIVIISDTHGLHDFISHPLPKADILIHAGDVCNIGTESDVRSFVYWFQNLKGYDTKIFIAGNHDWAFERKEPWLYNYINDENLSQSDCVYLEDSSFTIKDPKFSRPIKFYGSPWQPDFCNWAFNVPRDELYLYWEKIPLDTDVLITHGGPQGILDMNNYGEFCGCASLTTYTYKINPALHIFGHIHEAFGSQVIGETLFVNASTCTRRYVPSNKPIVVDLTEVDGKLIGKIIENESK